MSYRTLCPILSIGTYGYLDCKKQQCRFYIEAVEECSFVHNTIESNRIANALDKIARGITYSPNTEVPSIAEAATITAEAVNRIADKLQGAEE